MRPVCAEDCSARLTAAVTGTLDSAAAEALGSEEFQAESSAPGSSAGFRDLILTLLRGPPAPSSEAPAGADWKQWP